MKLFKHLHWSDNILFFDFETAPEYPDWKSLPQRLKDIFKKKFSKKNEDVLANPHLHYLQYAGLSPVFSKIVAASYYSIHMSKPETIFLGDTKASDKFLCEDFARIVKGKRYLCGHNIKGFDIPFFNIRSLHHGLKIPAKFDFSISKPWELGHIIDTLDILKMGTWSNYYSQDEMCYILGIESPKDKMDGSDVGTYFHQGKIEEIVEYCEKDVKTLARSLHAMYSIFIN